MTRNRKPVRTQSASDGPGPALALGVRINGLPALPLGALKRGVRSRPPAALMNGTIGRMGFPGPRGATENSPGRELGIGCHKVSSAP
jgi:hypothetical protein